METPQKKVIIWLVLIVIVLGAVWKFSEYYNSRPNSSLYQVVLLTNDQVFYGKLHDAGDRMPYLTDVYYLNPQARDVDKNGRPIGGAKFTVVKRGIDEIHQPTDAMYFARENILYWENVGSNSLVAQGIKADKDYRAKLAKPKSPTS